MPRTALRIGLVCALLLIASHLRGGEDPEARVKSQLAVQAALSHAEEHLKRGNYLDAVKALEAQVGYIDGNRRYLVTLRDSYAGLIAQLRQAGKDADAARYHERLLILQPSAALDARPAASPLAAKGPPEKAAPVPAALVTPGGLLSRGKVKEKPPSRLTDDPFSDENQVRPAGVSGLIDRAERAFASRDYDAAGRLYEEAEQAAAGPAGAARERWAYCKLFRVARVINGDGVPAGDDLEREVAEALKLSPKLETFAGQLREKMREALASATVKHTPREGAGWAVVETANFRLFHATTPEVAERAARLAEAARTAMARKWLGAVPANWTPRCDVYLHPTVKGYTAAGGSSAAPGHSSISLDKAEAGKVVSRRIDLRLDDPNVFTASLPHETTHVVLAGHFGKHHLPRWADEGIAVLSEGRDRVGLHLRNLPAFRRLEGKLFRLETLVKLEDYPDAERITPFYAQSVSLVELLVTKKGAPTLVKFIRDGLEGGYEAALKKHYGMESFGALEEEWLQHAFSDGVAKVAVKAGK